MEEIKVTLIGDGSSDKALLPILKWLLNDLYPTKAHQIAFADFRKLRKPPSRADVRGQIEMAKMYYPYDLLVYHRDAEDNHHRIIEKRKQEVLNRIDEMERAQVVCAVPIRMMETWLLISPEAIKKAASNRNYVGILELPSVHNLEAEKRPKELLHNALRKATGARRRKLQSFNVHRAVHLVADYTSDFRPLRSLEAFQRFETDLKHAVQNLMDQN